MRVSINEEKPPTLSHAQRKVAFFGYGAAVFFFWASLYLYVPTLPLYIQARTNTLAYVGTVLSMYGLWQAILRLPLGVAADLLGKRKPFILCCFAFSAAGALWMSIAGDVQGLILGRGITGLAAAGWVPLTVVFSSLFLPQEAVRASAILSFINAISRMSATSVTWLINDWSGGYTAAFFAAAGLALLGLIIVISLQEKFDSAVQKGKNSPTKGKDLLGVMIRPIVIMPSLLGALNQYAIFASSFGFFPILAKQFGANNFIQSAFSSMCLLMIMLGALVTSRLVRRMNATRLTFISFALLAMGLLGGALAQRLEVLMIAQLLVGLGSGIGYSVLMGLSIQQVDENERNTAMGVFQSIYGFGMFGGPWVSGILADMMGIKPMLAVTSLAIVCLGIGGTFILQRVFDQQREKLLGALD